MGGEVGGGGKGGGGGWGEGEGGKRKMGKEGGGGGAERPSVNETLGDSCTVITVMSPAMQGALRTNSARVCCPGTHADKIIIFSHKATLEPLEAALPLA